VKFALVFLFATFLWLPRAFGQNAPTFGTTVVIPAGLHGTVYLMPNSTTVLPDFSDEHLERVGELWTNSLSIPPRHWRTGFPGLTERSEWFAIDYDGKFWIDKPGRYTFALLSDDGSRLFIDNIPVIDNDCLHPPDLRIAAVKLEGGGHRLRVSYFQGPRDCLALVLAIAGPDEEWKIFDVQEFKPPGNPEDWQYTETSSLALVPTKPAEMHLTEAELFKRLALADATDKFKIVSKKKERSCADVPAVRICGH
jgi:PA14 domain